MIIRGKMWPIQALEHALPLGCPGYCESFKLLLVLRSLLALLLHFLLCHLLQLLLVLLLQRAKDYVTNILVLLELFGNVFT